MYLTLPIPAGRSTSKITLNQCLDAFVRAEVMEKSDAWYVGYLRYALTVLIKVQELPALQDVTKGNQAIDPFSTPTYPPYSP